MGVVCTGERFVGMDLSNTTAPMQTPQKAPLYRSDLSAGALLLWGRSKGNKWSGEPQGPSQLWETLGLFMFLKSYSKLKDCSITTSDGIFHFKKMGQVCWMTARWKHWPLHLYRCRSPLWNELSWLSILTSIHSFLPYFIREAQIAIVTFLTRRTENWKIPLSPEICGPLWIPWLHFTATQLALLPRLWTVLAAAIPGLCVSFRHSFHERVPSQASHDRFSHYK